MKITGKRVLVTGGAGFVGSHLVDRLAVSNQVSVLDDFSVGKAENLSGTPAPVRVIRGDIRDRPTVEAAVKDADVVFHLAVVCLRSSISDPMASHLVNDLGTLNLLLAARQNGPDRFVYVSSSEVYGTAVRGIVLAAECDELVGGRVNIARGQEVSVLTIAELVLELVGGRAEIEHHPARPGDVRRHLAGVELARTKLGFSAQVGIEDGLA